jgi:hypothetical protein
MTSQMLCQSLSSRVQEWMTPEQGQGFLDPLTILPLLLQVGFENAHI